MSKSPLTLKANPGGSTRECYFESDLVGVCCYKDGLIYKYTIDSSHPQTTSTLFANLTHDICSCMRSREGYIVAGGWHNDLYIIDNSGEVVTTIQASGEYVRDIAQTKSGLIITAETDNLHGGCTVVDASNILNDPTAPPSYTHPVQNERYLAVISLALGGDNYFAIAGAIYDDNYNGLIKIGEIETDFSVTFHKTHKRDSKGCTFWSIHEEEPGFIIIGGGYSCGAICTWKYMEEEKPHCDHISQENVRENTILDIVSIPD